MQILRTYYLREYPPVSTLATYEFVATLVVLIAVARGLLSSTYQLYA